jgi:hypothetical protein
MKYESRFGIPDNSLPKTSASFRYDILGGFLKLRLETMDNIIGEGERCESRFMQARRLLHLVAMSIQWAKAHCQTVGVRQI